MLPKGPRPFVASAVITGFVFATLTGTGAALSGTTSSNATVDGTGNTIQVKANGCARLDPHSRRMAREIWQVSEQMGMNTQAREIAYATAIQESGGINNLNRGDRDSLGLFQQRPSQGWGSPSEVTDPAHATRSFYQGLKGVEGWQSMPLTEAAQSVQRSAYPDAYAEHEDEAEAVVKSMRQGC